MTPAAVLSTQRRAVLTGGFHIREHEVVARGENPRHSHDYHCVGFLIRGLGSAELGSESWTVRPGSLNVIPGGVAHRERFGSRVIRWCGVEIPEVRDEFAVEAGRAFHRPVQIQGGPAASIVARMYRELRICDDASRLSLHGLGLELLAALARGNAAVHDGGRPAWITRAEECVRASFLDEVTLDEVAREAGVHPAHLARTFRRTFGASLGEFVRGLRVEHAATLLSQNHLSLSQVALACGFADQAHLTRAFKSRFGVPPGAWRRQGRS